MVKLESRKHSSLRWTAGTVAEREMITSGLSCSCHKNKKPQGCVRLCFPYHHIGPDIYMKGQLLWLHMDMHYETFYDKKNFLLSWQFAIHLKDEKLVSTFLFSASALSRESFSLRVSPFSQPCLLTFLSMKAEACFARNVKYVAFHSYLNKMTQILGLWWRCVTLIETVPPAPHCLLGQLSFKVCCFFVFCFFISTLRQQQFDLLVAKKVLCRWSHGKEQAIESSGR